MQPLKLSYISLQALDFYLERHRPMSHVLFCQERNKNKLENFRQKTWKFTNFHKTMFLYSRSKLLSSGKTTFLSKKVPNTFCRPILPRKRGRDENKLHIFHQNHKLTPLEKWNVCASLNVFLVDRLVFVSRTSPKRLFCLYIGYRMKKLIIFDPEQWTNQPLWKNANFANLIDEFYTQIVPLPWIDLFKSKKASLQSRQSPNIFSRPILHKKAGWANFNFFTKTMAYPFKKCQFSDLL